MREPVATSENKHYVHSSANYSRSIDWLLELKCDSEIASKKQVVDARLTNNYYTTAPLAPKGGGCIKCHHKKCIEETEHRSDSHSSAHKWAAFADPIRRATKKEKKKHCCC